MDPNAIAIRPATAADRDALHAMQAHSMRMLGAGAYTCAQIEAFIAVGTMDDSLLREGTYLVATDGGKTVASGGQSLTEPAYAAVVRTAGQVRFPDAEHPKIRSLFVHPRFARRGLASRLMVRIEDDIRVAGFDTVVLTATLCGVAFYLRRGYHETGRINATLPSGHMLEAVVMRKRLDDRHATPGAAV